MRFITPLLFLAAGGWVLWYNSGHADKVLLRYIFEGIAPGDIRRQGDLTAGLCFLIAGVFLVRDVIWWVRERR